MRFALSAEHRAFSASIHDLLTDANTPTVIRAWADGKHDAGLALWHRLGELGVTALAVPERHGGFGADAVDVAVAFEALGQHAVPGPLVESVVAVPTLLARCDAPALAERWLPELASGAAIATLGAEGFVSGRQGSHPATHSRTILALDADVADLRLLSRGGDLEEFTPTAEPARSIDPARRLFAAASSAPLVSDAGEACASALDAAAFAVSAQLLGLGRWLLEAAVDHARRRTQYGRPIGQYQAVKHLLADVVTRLELARPLVHGAAVALAKDDPTASRDVSAAKVAAADAAHLAARTALQVHGAIGYTAEHDLGLWLGKARALCSAWGTRAQHRRRVLDAVTRQAVAR